MGGEGSSSSTTAEIVPGAARITLGLILSLCSGAVGLVACSSAVQSSVPPSTNTHHRS